MLKKPKLLVFDLDHTLWPFYVDWNFNPPFRKGNGEDVFDAGGGKVKHFPEVPEVLQKLKDEGYLLGIASRTGEIDGANQLIELFGWNKFFTYKQIYPDGKQTHFKAIKKDSGIDFEDMIFFDDEQRNIRDVGELGTHAVLVRNGVTKQLVEKALREHGTA